MSDEQKTKKPSRSVTGNITIIPEEKWTPTGKHVVEFNIVFKNDEGKQCYLTCCCWEEGVQAAAKYLQHRGMPITVFGPVSKYKRQDGSVKYTMNVNCVFIPSGLTFSQDNPATAVQPASQGDDNNAPAPSTEEEDDIPF